MKPKAIQVGGYRIRTFADSRPQELEPLIKATRDVVCSSTVQGDHHAPNFWAYTVDERDFPQGKFSVLANGKVSYWYTQTLYNGLAYRSVDPILSLREKDYHYNAALSRLNEKVRGGLDLSVSLAEAGQTARMLNAVGRFRNFMEWYNRHYLVSEKRLGKTSIREETRNAERRARRLSDLWLEYQYGWRPLLADIYNAAEEGRRIVVNQIANFSASSGKQLSGILPASAATQYFVVNNFFTTRHRVQGREGCRFHIGYEIPGDRFDLTRWGSLNPVSIAWELLPYSFVVDWFVDVGSSLRNLETALLYGTRFKSGFYTELYACELWSNTQPFQRLGDYVCDQSSSHRRYIDFRRTVLSSYPFPRVPSFKAKLGSERILSAAALASQLLGLGRRR